MDFTKLVLGDIEKCYAAAGLLIDGAPYMVFAGEGQGSLHVFSGEAFKNCHTIWKGGGGTMSIVPLAEKEGWFLASRGFYSMVDAQQSTIEIIRFAKGTFSHEKIASLPNLHRFSVLQASDGARYILAATISRHKETKEDWSQPGQLFYARLPEDMETLFSLEMTALPGDYTVNHGYFQGKYNGCDVAYIGCREGVFRVTPPQCGAEEWRIEMVLDTPVSDIAVMDIDGDGEEEIAAIHPFHGNEFKILKKNTAGNYAEAYRYPVPHDFYHVVIGACLMGKPVFIGGGRRLGMQLFGVMWDETAHDFSSFVIDEGVGPSNAVVLCTSETDYVLSANRQIGQAAVYSVRK